MSSYQLFGFSDSSDVTPLSVGFIVIVGYLVLAGHGLSWLDEACRSTAYAQAVQSLYKELVIMGMSGFILTILLGTNMVDNNAWVYYLEIADVTLFFSALLHVFFSFSLILNNVSRNRSLKEKLAVDVHQLVDEISTSTAFRWNPFSDLRSQLELRVMRIMFLKQFKLDRAFDFARYVIRSEEHHIMQMLHVSPLHWALFLIGVVLNYVRVKYHIRIAPYDRYTEQLCRGMDDIAEYRECETATSQCLMFTLMLFGFLIVLLVMAFTSRFYVLRLMRINGPEKASQSCEYLLDDEIHDVQAQDTGNDGRMTLKNIKDTISDFKRTREVIALRRDSYSRQRREDVKKVFRRRKAISLSKEAGIVQTNGVLRGNLNKPTNHRGGILNEVARRRSSAAISNKMNERIILITHSGIQSGLFLFDVAWLYFSVRDICNLLLCLFYAFYLATIIAVSFRTSDPMFWNMLCAVALLACIVLQTYVIRESSTINAMSAFNSDVVGKVIEEQEEDVLIENMVREKILRKVKHAIGAEDVIDDESLKEAVTQLFTEIQNLDGISDDLVSIDELRVLLQKLNVYFSKSKFDRAFEIIDVDMSGTITLSEFVDFMFPDSAREKQYCLRREMLQAKGLLKKDGSTGERENTDATTSQRRNYFRAVFWRIRSAGIIPDASAPHSKYVPSVESEDVIAFKEKQKSIKLRGSGRLKKVVTNIRVVNVAQPTSSKDTKLYNTLEASKNIVERHRMDLCTDEDTTVDLYQTKNTLATLPSRQSTSDSISPSNALSASSTTCILIEKVTPTVLNGLVSGHDSANAVETLCTC